MSVIAAQAESIRKGAARWGTEWSVRELNKLRELRETGTPYGEIAQQLDRSYYAVTTMARIAGVSVTRTRTSKSTGPNACSECHLHHAGDCW